MKLIKLLSLPVAGVFGCLTSLAQTNIIAFTPPVLDAFSLGYAGQGPEPTGNDGLFFTPDVNITVTALGYVAPGSNVGNLVGLYDVTSSTLLASATVSSLSPDPGGFLYETIAPVALTAGHEYAVSGFFDATIANPDVGYTADSGVGAAPQITFDGYEYDYNNSLDLPNTSYTPAIFGPNFQYEVTPAPEPGTLALSVFGGTSLLLLLRRKTI